ncbi:exported protein of unknown function [Hyphomicrobium sp. 1Nfss2.1]|uniref:hypothetical protein n=1 Tax=Hyphomicrobium sp. 1Nfss2.1 TaxID=3413936 RepID=UPI003C7CC53A
MIKLRLSLLVATAAATPVLAEPVTSTSPSPITTPSLTDPLLNSPSANPLLTDPGSRKGTRNYKAGAEAVIPETESKGLSNKEKIAQCMDTWDTGTHITKSKWREICQRQLNER